MRINYKTFIEDNFLIKNKKGELVPFILNETQNYYWNLIWNDYPDMQGIRENILKFRQPGFSSLIDGIFTTDFIFSELELQPSTDGDIVSHKEKETKVLFNRVSLFLDSFLDRKGLAPMISGKIERSKFLEIDTTGHMKGRKGSELFVQTAGARTTGRGGTKQNIHWSECGFYNNTDVLNASDLVIGAEEQVADGVGKIFRESTGNIEGDFWEEEYTHGKNPHAKFKSRFLGWWLLPEYSKEAPAGWKPGKMYEEVMEQHGATVNQCYWHFAKIAGAKPKDQERIKREYPTTDTDAFMSQGSRYFNMDAVRSYRLQERSPLEESQFAHTRNVPGFYQYRVIEPGEWFVVASDCSQGGIDSNVTQFISMTKLDVPLVYDNQGVAATQTSAVQPVLEEIADVTGYAPIYAAERQNGGASEMERMQVLNRSHKYTLFVMPQIGNMQNEDTDKLGFDTSTATRPFIVGDLKDLIDVRGIGIYHPKTVAELATFIINNQGKPEAARGKHDDHVMSLGIGNQLRIRCTKPLALHAQSVGYQNYQVAMAHVHDGDIGI